MILLWALVYVCLSVSPSVHLSACVYLYVCLCMFACLSVYPSVCPALRLFIYLPVSLCWACPSVHTLSFKGSKSYYQLDTSLGSRECMSVCPSVHLPVCGFAYMSVCPYLSIYLSFRLSTYLSICLSIYPTGYCPAVSPICLSVHSSISVCPFIFILSVSENTILCQFVRLENFLPQSE